MDGSAAIEWNRQALKRIVAMLVAMADAAECTEAGVPTLPRHLWLAILRLLRPAEAAARRLIIAAARGLVAPLPLPRKPRPKPATMEPQLRRFGIAVVISPADLARDAGILPRLRGRGTAEGGGGSATSADRSPQFAAANSAGSNSYSFEQNSQLTAILPSSVLSTISSAEKPSRMPRMRSREHEHSSATCTPGKTRTPCSWNSL